MMRWQRFAEAAYRPALKWRLLEPPKGVEVREAQTFTDQRRPVVIGVVRKELAAVKAGGELIRGRRLVGLAHVLMETRTRRWGWSGCAPISTGSRRRSTASPTTSTASRAPQAGEHGHPHRRDDGGAAGVLRVVGVRHLIGLNLRGRPRVRLA